MGFQLAAGLAGTIAQRKAALQGRDQELGRLADVTRMIQARNRIALPVEGLAILAAAQTANRVAGSRHDLSRIERAFADRIEEEGLTAKLWILARLAVAVVGRDGRLERLGVNLLIASLLRQLHDELVDGIRLDQPAALQLGLVVRAPIVDAVVRGIAAAGAGRTDSIRIEHGGVEDHVHRQIGIVVLKSVSYTYQEIFWKKNQLLFLSSRKIFSFSHSEKIQEINHSQE